MNRVNPLYILLLLVMLLGFFSVKLSHAKDELTHAQQNYKETVSLVNELDSLKNIYENKQENKAALERIVIGSKAELEQEQKENSVIFHAQAIDYNTLNRLVGKLLNGSFEINSMEIRKQNEKSAKLSMEIKW